MTTLIAQPRRRTWLWVVTGIVFIGAVVFGVVRREEPTSFADTHTATAAPTPVEVVAPRAAPVPPPVAAPAPVVVVPKHKRAPRKASARSATDALPIAPAPQPTVPDAPTPPPHQDPDAPLPH